MQCKSCPRTCGIDRGTAKGFCGVSDKITIARASLHMWEEPCISGNGGSGTVFFTGCNLNCVYCQNSDISHDRVGLEITPERLYEIFFELKKKGAETINLVTPSHYTDVILPVLISAKKNGLNLPIVYNCGGYESVDTLKKLEGVVDIFMPDFKYFSGQLGAKYSQAADYPEVAMSAISEMHRQQPEPVFDKNGMLKKGVLVRILVLPTHTDEAKRIIHYLYKTYGDSIYMSIMNQYTPIKAFDEFPELNLTVTQKEYDDCIDYAVSLGVENAFIQEGGSADESFIPDFKSFSGVLENS